MYCRYNTMSEVYLYLKQIKSSHSGANEHREPVGYGSLIIRLLDPHKQLQLFRSSAHDVGALTPRRSAEQQQIAVSADHAQATSAIASTCNEHIERVHAVCIHYSQVVPGSVQCTKQNYNYTMSTAKCTLSIE